MTNFFYFRSNISFNFTSHKWQITPWYIFLYDSNKIGNEPEEIL